MIKLGSHVAFKKPDYLVGSIKERQYLIKKV